MPKQNYFQPDADVQRSLNEMAKKEREALPSSAFVFPDRRAWPIHNEEHAKIALQYVKEERGESSDWPFVLKGVFKRYPEMKTYAKELGLMKAEEARTQRENRLQEDTMKRKRALRESVREHLCEEEAERTHTSAMVGIRYRGQRVAPNLVARLSTSWLYDKQTRKTAPEFQMTVSELGESVQWLNAPKFEKLVGRLLLVRAQDEGMPPLGESIGESNKRYTGVAEIGTWKRFADYRKEEYVFVRSDTDEIAESVMQSVSRVLGLKDSSTPERIQPGVWMQRVPTYEEGYDTCVTEAKKSPWEELIRHPEMAPAPLLKVLVSKVKGLLGKGYTVKGLPNESEAIAPPSNQWHYAVIVRFEVTPKDKEPFVVFVKGLGFKDSRESVIFLNAEYNKTSQSYLSMAKAEGSTFEKALENFLPRLLEDMRG